MFRTRIQLYKEERNGRFSGSVKKKIGNGPQFTQHACSTYATMKQRLPQHISG